MSAEPRSSDSIFNVFGQNRGCNLVSGCSFSWDEALISWCDIIDAGAERTRSSQTLARLTAPAQAAAADWK